MFGQSNKQTILMLKGILAICREQENALFNKFRDLKIEIPIHMITWVSQRVQEMIDEMNDNNNIIKHNNRKIRYLENQMKRIINENRFQAKR